MRFRPAIVLLVAALLAPASDAAADACKNAKLVPGTGDVAKARKATLCVLNQERREHGLRKMRASDKLREAAEQHSADMVDRQFFDHVAPGGLTLTERVLATDYLKASISSWFLAENIGWGTGSFASPRGIVKAWMDSPGHRANILNPKVRDAGVGIALGTPGGMGAGATYTLDLGRTG